MVKNETNIIIRTSNRPNYFYTCIQSVKKHSPNSLIHVIIDDIGDLEYVKNNMGELNYNYYIINKDIITDICRDIKIERSVFIYNYYFNYIKPFLSGWCLFLDDDDELLIDINFEKSIDTIYLYRVNINKKLIPDDSYFGKKPVLNNISGSSIVFHSSQMVNWKPQRGGDFDFISELYSKYKVKWINNVIIKTQDKGNFGKRNDKVEKKSISKLKESKVLVVIPTYESERTILDSINSILNQTHKNIDIIVVDDCSTDNTYNLLKDLTTIKYYRLTNNVGTYNAINYGLSKCNDFDYFIIHGADDLMLNTNIEEHLKGFTKNIEAVIAGYDRINYETKKIVDFRESGDSMVMYSKHVFDKIGYYDDTRFGGDSEYYKRFLKYFGIKNLKDLKKSLSNCYMFNDSTNLTIKIKLGTNIRKLYTKKYENKHNSIKTKDDLFVGFNNNDLVDTKVDIIPDIRTIIKTNVIPEDFIWYEYLKLNPDVAKYSYYNSERGAKQHWVSYGYKENRRYKVKKAPHIVVKPIIIKEQFVIIKEPKVLVVIPTYNSDKTILESINSVLEQTYKNITIVVIDDCSTDNTYDLLKDLTTIKYYRLDENVGTFSAINYGFYNNQDFDYSIVHDADDLMLKTNIEEHLKGFTNNIGAVVAGYTRINYDTKEVISTKKQGHSMVMYSKLVFDKIGYFDDTRFGGDSEYYERFLKYFNVNNIKFIELSLSNCYVFNNGTNLTTTVKIGSDARKQYVAKYKNKHNNVKNKKDLFIQYNNKYNKKYDGKKLISVNMATYPKREKVFLTCLNNLLTIDSIDIIRIYLNEYKTIPENFPKKDKITYHIGKDNLKDSGKFYWSSELKNEYYFSIDDDLLYSEEYINNHILTLKKHDNEIFVTTHGKIMKDTPSTFNNIKKGFRCLDDMKNDEWVNNPGTGVSVFDNSKYVIPLSLFKYHGMTDLWVGVYCQKMNIPILCRKHTKSEISLLHVDDTLFDRRGEMVNEHKKVLDLIDKWVLYKK